jgi:hypothetical protein
MGVTKRELTYDINNILSIMEMEEMSSGSGSTTVDMVQLLLKNLRYKISKIGELESEEQNTIG